MKALSLVVASLITALLASSCVAPPRTAPKPVAAAVAHPKAKPAYWNAEAANGSARIIVKLGEQRAYFYKGENLVGEAPVSSGRTGFDTPPGKYRVTQKDEKHVSNLYGDFVDANGEIVKRGVDMSKDKVPEGAVFSGASMPYFLRFTSGYGLHAGMLPGHRASHGCIRLPRTMAQHFFEHAEVGTPVEVEAAPAVASPVAGGTGGTGGVGQAGGNSAGTSGTPSAVKKRQKS